MRALEKVLQNLRVWVLLRGVNDFWGSKKKPVLCKLRRVGLRIVNDQWSRGTVVCSEFSRKQRSGKELL